MRRSVQASSGVHRGDPIVSAGNRRNVTDAAKHAYTKRRFTSLTRPVQPVALTQAIEDYAAVDEVETLPEVEALVPLGIPSHYRIALRKPYGVGHVEFCGLVDGFFIHVADIDFHDPHAMSVSAPNMLRVRIANEGDGEYATTRGDLLDIRGPSASIIIEPAGVPPADAVFAGHNRAAHVYIHGETLKQLYTGREHELPAVLQAFIAGTLQRTVARRLPLTPSLLRCLDDLQNLGLESHARRLFIQSKAVEILCHAFDALRQEDDLGSAEASTLATRGVVKAQRLLMENFVAPPSLEDLAHAVGMSRSGLCSAFRQIMGQTVFDYISDLRMQRALALLRQRNNSITQIAYEVGYSNPSSFSVAVLRRFGTTPSDLRRRHGPAGALENNGSQKRSGSV